MMNYIHAGWIRLIILKVMLDQMDNVNCLVVWSINKKYLREPNYR